MNEHDDDLDLEGDDDGLDYMDENLAGVNRLIEAFGLGLRRAVAAESEPTEGQRFLKAFGRMGGVWFAEGKTFAEAEALYGALMPKPPTSRERVAAGITVRR